MIPKSNPKSKKKPPEMPVTAVSGAFFDRRKSGAFA